MEYQIARRESEKNFLPHIEDIRAGREIRILERFARIYLGLMYELDNALPPDERMALLAGETLTGALLEGFVRVLNEHPVLDIHALGTAYAKNEQGPLGYIMLAGADVLFRAQDTSITSLPGEKQQMLLCLHYTHTSYVRAPWAQALLLRPEISVPVFNRFWPAILENGGTTLPAYLRIFRGNDTFGIVNQTVIPLLKNWHACRRKYLLELLYAAFHYASHEALLAVAREKLANPDALDETRYMYWYATAFIISPDEFGPSLASHTGRVKLKVLPLLDFIIGLIRPDQEDVLPVSPMCVAHALRIIAPVFPPHTDCLEGLDINTQNVLWLFYLLASDTDREAQAALKWLRKARVMKICSGILKYIEGMHRGAGKPGYRVPRYPDFVEKLVEKDLLQGRSNRYDVH